MTDEEKLRANAALAVETLAPLSDVAGFGFNRESVAWVEGYIERQRVRPDMTDETKNGLVSVLGSFLGECLIQTYGGKWKKDEGGLGVFFDEGNAAFPINKVRKQFDNGIDGGDSILSLFDSAGVLFKQKIVEVKSRKPWWKFW